MRSTRHPAAARVFNALAPLWPVHDRERSDALQATARRIVRALRPGGSVLDVGCGTGALLAAVRAAAREIDKPLGTLAGVDVATGMVRLTRRRRGVIGVRGDALNLPFVDQVFDVVVCTDVLQFLSDPVRAAREMFRVAVPGGTILAELPPSVPGSARTKRLASRLRPTSLLRHYLELPRSFGLGAFTSTLEGLRCDWRELPGLPGSSRFLQALARASGRPEELVVAAELAEASSYQGRALWVRLPGLRDTAMPVSVYGLEGWSAARVRELIGDLPVARGYHLIVKPLRYRTRPHVQAFCEFDSRRIIVQVPVPFRAFHEDVPYRAQRVGAKGFNFRWYRRRLRFERPDELIRYLYLHEYYHWFVREVLGKRSAATETACDRFALQRL